MLTNDYSWPYGRGNVNLSSVTLSKNDKEHLVRRILTGSESIKSTAEKHNLNVNTVSAWVKRYKMRGYLCSEAGRTESVSKKHQLALVAQLKQNKLMCNRKDFERLLMDAALKTAQDLDPLIVSVPKPSKSTLDRLTSEMGLKMGNAEVVTPSRELATSDIFNAISFFVANYVFLNVLSICPALCVNADATQFACGGKSDETVEVLYLDDQISSKKSRSLKASSSSESSGDGIVSYFIKFYLIISNGGHMSPPVYMLADDNMDAEELRVYKIEMLGIGTNLEQNFGYVVITKTRCANVKFYKWLNEEVVVPFINSLRAKYRKMLTPFPFPNDAWFQLDGEPVQIEILKTKQMQDLFIENEIHVGKPPASTTALTQPCDAGNCFKGPKTTNRHLRDADVKDNILMRNVLAQLFCTHNEWLNSDERGDRRLTGTKKKSQKKEVSGIPKIEMKPSHVTMAKHGLLRVQFAMSKSMNSKTIRTSFSKVGMYHTGMDFDTVMDNWKTNVPEKVRKLVWDNMDNLVDKYMQQGELFEEDLMDLQIDPTVERRGKPQDKLCISRRRSCLLTHHALIAREELKESAASASEMLTRKRKREIEDEQEVIYITID